MRPTRVLLIAVLALGSWTAESRADCPINSWGYGPGFGGSSTAPAFNFGAGSYDLIAGTFSANSSGGGEVGFSTSVSLGDTYWLVGPPSATPIAFRARVDLSGHASAATMTLPGPLTGCFGSGMTFELREGASVSSVSAQSSSSPCAGVDIDETALLVIEKLPGEPFTLRLNSLLSNSTFQSVNVSGILLFVAVPPGYSIASCQGFAGPTVPASPGSWGQLKHTYR